MLLLVVLYALFGFSFTLGKVILSYSTPLFAVGIRMIIGGAVLGGYIFLRHKISCYPKRQDLTYYIYLVIFGIVIPYSLRLWALEYVPTIKASLLFTSAPFFTAIITYLVNKERITKLQTLGLTVGFIGMLPILSTASPLEETIVSFWIISLPELAILVAVASLSYSLVILQKMVKDRDCPPYLANGVSMFLGGIITLGLSFSIETKLIRASVYKLFGILLLQIGISNVICANLRAVLLKKYSTTFMSFAGFLVPLFTSIFGVFLFGEHLSWQFFASFFIVVVGLAIYCHEDKHVLEVKA